MQTQLEKTSFTSLFCLTLILFSFFSCAPSKQFSYSSVGSAGNSSFGLTETPGLPIDVSPPVATLPVVEKTMLALSWEKSNPQSILWSKYMYSVIEKEEPQMLNADAALDTDLFCPRFKEMTRDQRLNFWGELFSGMAKYESGWDPTSRYIEVTMPNDSITGQPTASEGLLQLSYQDVPNYGGVCEFDWNKDKTKNSKDSTRSILDPYKNLRCGIKIMARIIKKRGVIATDTGAYWAVIKKNGSHHKINEISAMTKSLKFCLSAN